MANRDLEDSVVPYRVAVIDVATTIQQNGLCKTDDILGKHIEQRDPMFAPVLLAARGKRRMLLVLDGIDEVGIVLAARQLSFFSVLRLQL